MKKTCAVFLLLGIILLGLACGGGGGSSLLLPVLPEGSLHLFEEDMDVFFENTPLYPLFGKEYIEVTDALDESLLPLPGNPAETIWGHGLFLLASCNGENGFLLVIEPDDEYEEITRLSVAFHNRGINLTEETLDFILENPEENSFLVVKIMRMLEESGDVVEAFSRIVSGRISIKANGTYASQEKEGAEEALDELYSQVPPWLQPFVTREQMRSYISQQVYQSSYAGGEEITLTGLLHLLMTPSNWALMDFKITIDTVFPFSELMTDIIPRVDRDYPAGSLSLGNPVYGGALGGDVLTGYMATAFPEEIGGREIIRTCLEDAAEEGEGFLDFILTKPAVLYIAADPGNQALISLLTGDGWTRWEDGATPKTILAARPPFTSEEAFHLYRKDFTGESGYPLPLSLPGNGDGTKMMYFVIADAGTYPFGLDILVSSHTALVQDNPENAGFYTAPVKQEGGMVVNGRGITLDGETGLPLIHVDFVQEFDANVLVDTENTDNLQSSINDFTDIRFIEHVLKNNGFRLIDTYNDLYPAFGGESQVLQIERLLGYELDEPVRMALLQEELFTFANMNLLNSPNLAGIYLKSIRTDAEGVEVWKDEENDKGLNTGGLIEYIGNNAISYSYSISSVPGTLLSLQDLLKRAGKSGAGELTFDILIEFPGGKKMDIRAGIFLLDYFTNVYDALMGGFFE